MEKSVCVGPILLNECVELPPSDHRISGFPKGDKLEFIAQKVTELFFTNLCLFPAVVSVQVGWQEIG